MRLRHPALSTMMSLALLLPWAGRTISYWASPTRPAARTGWLSVLRSARYQYLAGGVNTGQGWATWNPDGTFASMYVQESIAAHMITVLSYYQLLQSNPAAGSGESQKDLSNLRNPSTMTAYWNDYRLLLKRVGSAAGRHLAVIHVEPDLWGYLEQAHATALARTFARKLVALRTSWRRTCCSPGI